MMANVQIVPAELSHIDQMDGNFAEINEEECWAFNRMNACESLKFALQLCEMSRVILVDGNPIACFGINRKPTNPKLGTTWMLVTKDFKKHGARLIVREAKPCLIKMLNGFSIIEAWTFKKNKPTVRWLKWCGFEQRGEYNMGVDHQPFMNFRLCKDKLNGH